MSVTVHKLDFNQFDKNQWNTLFFESKCSSFFQSYDWLSIWLKHFSVFLDEVIILGVYSEDTLIGIGPFAKYNNTINYLGTSFILNRFSLTDYGDIIAKRGSEKLVWQKLLETLDKFCRSTELLFIRDGSISCDILKEQFNMNLTPIEVAPLISLPDTWEAYLAILSSHDRHELKRKIRKAEAQGFQLIDVSDNSVNEFMNLARLAKAEKAFFYSSIAGEFFKEMLHTLSDDKTMHTYLLTDGEICIASTVIIHTKNTEMAYNSVFNPNYLSLSPGIVLFGLIIKKAIFEKKQYFDFLRGNEAYKYRLGAIDQILLKGAGFA